MLEVAGNSCIFTLFRIFTLSLVVVSLANIIGGVVAIIKTNSFAWYNGAYLFIGTVLMVLAIFGDTVKTNLRGLTLYLIGLTISFCAQTGFSLAIIFYEDYRSFVGSYADALRYTMLVASLIVLAAVIVGFCYRSSLKDAQFYSSNENLIHPRASEEPLPRPSIRREEIEKKYGIGRKTIDESARE